MVRIISDSSTLYSVAEGKMNNIDIASLIVTINNKSYKELEEIDTQTYVSLIQEGHIPTTSQPTIGEVVELYENCEDEEIINISMADGLSGTYNSACMAKEMVENKSITVVNSKTLCGPHRYLVDTAAKMANEGKTKNEILDVVNQLIDQSISFLIPHDFDFLVRGGRLSPLAGRIGSVIGLVPVMTLSEDCKKLEKFTMKRTFKKAIQKIGDALIDFKVDETYKIYVSHAINEELAQTAVSIIKNMIPNADIEVMFLTPAFTTHGGPSCVAVQAIKKQVD